MHSSSIILVQVVVSRWKRVVRWLCQGFQCSAGECWNDVRVISELCREFRPCLLQFKCFYLNKLFSFATTTTMQDDHKSWITGWYVVWLIWIICKSVLSFLLSFVHLFPSVTEFSRNIPEVFLSISPPLFEIKWISCLRIHSADQAQHPIYFEAPLSG